MSEDMQKKELEDALGITAQKNRKAQMEAENAAIPAEITAEVDTIIGREFPPERHHFGVCHEIWTRKTDLYLERGYRWYAPSVMNPHIIYD